MAESYCVPSCGEDENIGCSRLSIKVEKSNLPVFRISANPSDRQSRGQRGVSSGCGKELLTRGINSMTTQTLSKSEKIAVSNQIMNLFRGGNCSRIEQKGSHLWLISKHWDKDKPDIEMRIVLSKSREFLGGSYGRHGMGHTRATVVGQLVRWIRDDTRHHLNLWRYWCSDKIGLGGLEIIELLEANGYGDPKKTNCILCGKEPIPAGDWWDDHENNRYGPICLYNQCSVITGGGNPVGQGID